MPATRASLSSSRDRRYSSAHLSVRLPPLDRRCRVLSEHSGLSLAGGEQEADFEQAKTELIDGEQNKQLEKALPKALTGWGDWTGKGVKPSKRPSSFMKDLESKRKAFIASRKKRADDGLRHVLINEKKNKKAAVFEASSVPFGFGNRSLYEASIRQPVDRDWNTAATTKRQTQQEVVTRLGNVIAPLKMTKGRKATKRRPLAR